MPESQVTGKRLSAAQWQAVLERQATSHQTVEAFCRSESISTASFYRWRRMLSEPADGASPRPASATPAFLDLGSLEGARRDRELELHLGDGLVLRLRGG